MTPGQRDYERDVQQRPTYPDGSPRKKWCELPALAQWSWDQGAETKDRWDSPKEQVTE